MMLELLEWLGNTPWSIALIESLQVWSLEESAHVVILAGLNVWFFRSRIHRRICERHFDASPPRAARVAAFVSIVAWATVVVAGRLTAREWMAGTEVLEASARTRLLGALSIALWFTVA